MLIAYFLITNKKKKRINAYFYNRFLNLFNVNIYINIFKTSSFSRFIFKRKLYNRI